MGVSELITDRFKSMVQREYEIVLDLKNWREIFVFHVGIEETIIEVLETQILSLRSIIQECKERGKVDIIKDINSKIELIKEVIGDLREVSYGGIRQKVLESSPFNGESNDREMVNKIEYITNSNYINTINNILGKLK